MGGCSLDCGDVEVEDCGCGVVVEERLGSSGEEVEELGCEVW